MKNKDFQKIITEQDKKPSLKNKLLDIAGKDYMSSRKLILNMIAKGESDFPPVLIDRINQTPMYAKELAFHMVEAGVPVPESMLASIASDHNSRFRFAHVLLDIYHQPVPKIVLQSILQNELPEYIRDIFRLMLREGMTVSLQMINDYLNNQRTRQPKYINAYDLAIMLLHQKQDVPDVLLDPIAENYSTLFSFIRFLKRTDRPVPEIIKAAWKTAEEYSGGPVYTGAPRLNEQTNLEPDLKNKLLQIISGSAISSTTTAINLVKQNKPVPDILLKQILKYPSKAYELLYELATTDRKIPEKLILAVLKDAGRASMYARLMVAQRQPLHPKTFQVLLKDYRDMGDADYIFKLAANYIQFQKRVPSKILKSLENEPELLSTLANKLYMPFNLPVPDIIIRALEKYAQKGFEKKRIHSNRMDSKDADYEARYIKAYNMRYFPNLDMQHENVENKLAQQEDPGLKTREKLLQVMSHSTPITSNLIIKKIMEYQEIPDELIENIIKNKIGFIIYKMLLRKLHPSRIPEKMLKILPSPLDALSVAETFLDEMNQFMDPKNNLKELPEFFIDKISEDGYASEKLAFALLKQAKHIGKPSGTNKMKYQEKDYADLIPEKILKRIAQSGINSYLFKLNAEKYYPEYPIDQRILKKAREYPHP